MHLLVKHRRGKENNAGLAGKKRVYMAGPSASMSSLALGELRNSLEVLLNLFTEDGLVCSLYVSLHSNIRFVCLD